MQYEIKRGRETLCRVKSLERTGRWMGERNLIVNVESAYPIDFKVGDYIVYSGDTFTLGYIPSVNKQARSGSHGAAFQYNSIKFSGAGSELSSMRCRLINSGSVSYESTFNYFCNDITEFAALIQKNLDRWWSEQTDTFRASHKPWKVSYPSKIEASVNVLVNVQRQSVLQVLECVQKQFNTTYTIRETATHNVIMLCDDGSAELEGLDALRYGIGNGLLSIERNSNTDVNVVTRIRAFGSTKNMPSRYYSNPYEPWYRMPKSNSVHLIRSVKMSADRYYIYYIIDVLSVHATSKVTAYAEGLEGELFTAYSQGELNDQTASLVWGTQTGIPQEYADKYQTFKGCLYVMFEVNTPVYNMLNGHGVLVITGGILKKGTIRHKEWWISPYPKREEYYNVKNLMLPDFLAYRVLDEYGNEMCLNPALCEVEYENGNVTGVRYNGKLYHPIMNGRDIAIKEDVYIQDDELVSQYGIIEDEVYFDNEENGEIYPTIEGTRREEAEAAGYMLTYAKDDNGYIDEVAFSAGQYYTADKQLKSAPTDRYNAFDDFHSFDEEGYGDDGIPRSVDDEKLWNGMKTEFYLFVKDMGFDPRLYFSVETAQIYMKSGMCSGRSFEVLEGDNPIPVMKDGVVYWRYRCSRQYDEASGMWFPNKNANISGKPRTDEPRVEDGGKTIAHTDRFVLINFELPRMYVDAASARLKAAAQEYFAKVKRTTFTYVPKIDSIMMQRNRDMAELTGEKSYHDVLREGMVMKISDTDLGITNGKDTSRRTFHIDSLTVREDGTKLPEYTIVLREEAEMTAFERLQKQIVVIQRSISAIGSGETDVVTTNTQGEMVSKGFQVSAGMQKGESESTRKKLADIAEALEGKWDFVTTDYEAEFVYNDDGELVPEDTIPSDKIYPSDGWDDTESESHIGDYLITSNGLTYRYTKNGEAYVWQITSINDPYLIDALRAAAVSNENIQMLREELTGKDGAVTILNDQMAALVEKAGNDFSGFVTTSTAASVFASSIADDKDVQAAITVLVEDGISHANITADQVSILGNTLSVFSKNFKLDENGNASFSGELEAATGTFSGDIHALRYYESVVTYDNPRTGTDMQLGTDEYPLGTIIRLRPKTDHDAAYVLPGPTTCKGLRLRFIAHPLKKRDVEGDISYSPFMVSLKCTNLNMDMFTTVRNATVKMIAKLDSSGTGAIFDDSVKNGTVFEVISDGTYWILVDGGHSVVL